MIASLRFFYAIAFLSMMVCPCMSQTFSLKTGEALSMRGLPMSFNGCHIMEGNDYVLSFSEFNLNHAKLLLSVFDQNLKLKASKTYELDENRSETVALAHSRDKMAWFTTHRPKTEDSLSCSMAIGSAGDGFGEHVTLFKVFAKSSAFLPSITQYTVSPDSSRHAIHAVHDKEDMDAKTAVGLVVLDKDFNALWRKNFVLDYTERRLKALSWAVLPSGDACMLAKVYGNDKLGEAAKRDGNKVPDYKLVIFKFSKGENRPKEYELGLGELFVNSAAIFANEQHELTCAGFLAKNPTGNSVGVFHLRLDAINGNTLAMNKHEFEKDDLAQFGKIDFTQDKDGDWGISSDFNFKQVLNGSDGKTILLAEDKSEGMEGGGSVSSGDRWEKRFYYKNGVAIFPVDAKGNFETIRLVRKQQRMSKEVFGGFTAWPNDNGLFLFYNDHEDNLGKGLHDKIKTIEGFGQDMMPMVVLQTPDGDITKKPLYDIKAVESVMLPMYIQPIRDQQLLFVFVKTRGVSTNWDFQLGLVRLGN